MRQARVRQLVDARPSPAWSAESAADSATRRCRRGAAPARARCRDSTPGAGCARRARTAPGRRQPARSDGMRITLRSRSAFFTRRIEAHDVARRAAAPRTLAVRSLPCPRVVLHRVGIDRRIERARRIEMRRVDLDPARRRRLRANAVPRRSVMLVDALAGGEAMRDLDDLPLGIAVHQQVGLGIEQDRAAHLLRPVVEMRDAPQDRLDAADDDRHVPEGLAHALRIDDHRAIGPPAAVAARACRHRRCGCAGRRCSG